MNNRDQRRNHSNNHAYNSRNEHARNRVIPNESPFTAYIGNAPDTMVQGDFERKLFVGLKVKQVRLVRDRQTDRFRGFAYVDFEDADSLRSAIALDGTYINDRPIRIDVAVRTLKSSRPEEGFRNKFDYHQRNNFQQISTNANQLNNDFTYSERSKNRKHLNERESLNNNFNQMNSSQNDEQEFSLLEQKFNEASTIADTSNSSHHESAEKINEKSENEGEYVPIKYRNWADCPIDESTNDTFTSPNTANTLTDNNFQADEKKIPKSYTDQHISSRSINNEFVRERNGRNNSHNSSSSNNRRSFFDPISMSHTNQSQMFTRNTNHSTRHQSESFSKEKFRSNRPKSNTDDTSNHNRNRLTSRTSTSSNEMQNNNVLSNRPRLQLLPRSDKLSSSTDDNQSIESPIRNSTIFGYGKPRDERDPKLVQLNKHIEEVVEKEQHSVPIASTSSYEPANEVIKPIRILTTKTKSLIDH